MTAEAAASPGEDAKARVRSLQRASLLVRVAASALNAGSEKAAAQTLREALEIIAVCLDTPESGAELDA